MAVWRSGNLRGIKFLKAIGIGLGAVMDKSTQTRTNIVGLLTILVLSSALMLWMLWHYPKATGIATLIVLAALGISTRLARWIDTDNLSDFTHQGLNLEK